MRARGLLFALLANVLGGLSYLAQKLALEGLPPATVTFLRNALAWLLMVAWIRSRGTPRERFGARDLGLLALLGTVGYGLPMWLGIVGVQRSTAANGSILVLIEPMMVLVFAAAFLHERVAGRQVAGVAIGLAGALVIVLEGASFGDLFAGRHVQGNLILALHGVLWGTFTPLVKPLSMRHDPVVVILHATAISLLLLAPAAWLERDAWVAGPALVPALGWTAALALGVSFASAALWAAAARYVAAATIAPFVFVQPVVGVLGAAWILGERLTAPGAAGAAVIGVGLAVALLGRAPDAGPPRSAAPPE